MRKPRSRPQHLASKLLSIRSKLGVSQIEMARILATGEHYHRLSEYESGRREPNLLVLLAYSNLSGHSINELVDDKVKLSE
jgi:transcriptional regulator with XRE-family HTH domain